MLKMMIFLLAFCLLSLKFGLIFAKVVIIRNNETRSFESTDANFAPLMKVSGEYGKLYLSEPLDACSELTNKVNGTGKETMLPFALITRGACSFEAKVRQVQKAGFKAAIIFDNVDIGDLVAMRGNSDGIKIHAMFVSKKSGEMLAKYAGDGDGDAKVLLLPNFKKSDWFTNAICLLLILSAPAVLACFLFCSLQVEEFRSRRSDLVKALPSLVFTSVLDDRCTSIACAICLEDYTVGEKLRILPCSHKFHAPCVDEWLTTKKTFCPVCKRDARDLPPTERTPLLPVSIPVSPAIQIYPSSTSSRSHSSPQIHSVPSYRHSPFLGAAMRIISSYRSIDASPRSSSVGGSSSCMGSSTSTMHDNTTIHNSESESLGEC